MGRTPCCEKNNGLKRGPWTPEEDQKLVDYIQKHGYGNWRTLPNNAGLQRCGKSCRLRWTNYLRPDIKRGRFSFEEEEAIIQLHSILGNKWSAIASRLPGRTDNEIKNYWNTHIRKRLLRMGIDPVTHSPRLDLLDLSSVLTFSSSSSSSQMNMQHQLNPELLKLLASSLFSNNSSSSHNITTTTHQQDINCNPQIQNDNNHIPQQHLFVEPNVDPYQSNFHHDYFGSPSSPQLHNHCYSSSHQLTDNWHTNGIASSSPFDDTTAHQLPSSYDDYYYDNNYNINNNNNLVVVDPPLSEIWTTFQCSNNNSNQNLSNLASVLSTPSSSPKALNSNSTYVNGSSCSTEDERDSYICQQQQQHYVEI